MNSIYYTGIDCYKLYKLIDTKPEVIEMVNYPGLKEVHFYPYWGAIARNLISTHAVAVFTNIKLKI